MERMEKGQVLECFKERVLGNMPALIPTPPRGSGSQRGRLIVRSTVSTA